MERAALDWMPFQVTMLQDAPRVASYLVYLCLFVAHMQEQVFLKGGL